MYKQIILVLFFVVLILSSCEGERTSQQILTPFPTDTEKLETLIEISTPTPSGKSNGKILYQSNNTSVNEVNVYDIYTIDLDNLESYQLSNGSNKNISFEAPIPSHSGEKIAYVTRTKSGGVSGGGNSWWTSHIYIMEINGKNQKKISGVNDSENFTQIKRNLIFDNNPSWSPNDKKIAFESNRDALINGYSESEIFVIDLETLEINQLTKAAGSSLAPSWSPDGQYIVFMSDRDGDWDIYFMKSDGSGKDQRITSNSSADKYPNWSNDGNYLIYSSDRDGNSNLYIYDIKSEEEVRLTDFPDNEVTAKWSPDDNRVVYSSDRDGDYEIYILDMLMKEEMKLTNNDVNNVMPNWIP